MNIDLLPFSAFALESSGAAVQAVGEGQTLTLPLDLLPVHAAFEPSMSGWISIAAAEDGPGDSLHAAVVPSAGERFTITF